MIVLDLDGTILDVKARHHGCYRALLMEAGGVPLAADDYWRAKRAGTDARTVLAMTGAEHLEDWFKEAWLRRIESQEMLGLDRVLDGVLPVLDGWVDSGVAPVVVVTARQDETATFHQLDELGLSGRITGLVCSAAGGSGTHKGKALQARYPDQAWVAWIGDTEADVAAAGEVGTVAIGVASGIRSEHYLRGLGVDLVVADLPAAARSLEPELTRLVRDRDGNALT